MPGRKILPAEIEWVQMMLAQCHTRTICERRIAAHFDCTTRTARRYMKRAWDDLREHSEATRQERREKVRLTLEHVLDSAVAGDDLKHAILAANSLAKLDGLDEPEKHEVSGALAISGETDPEKALARLQELRQAQDKKPSDG